MRSWLDSFSNSLGSIAQGILNLPSLIWSYFSDFFDGLINYLLGLYDLLNYSLYDIWQTILNLPTEIAGWLYDIFVPNTEDITLIWQDTVDRISMKFGFLKYDVNDMFRTEKPVEDVSTDYTFAGLGTFNIPILNTEYLSKGIAFFKPLIRGFLALMIILYNMRQFMSFFSLDSGISGSSVSTYSNYKEYKEKGDK